MPDSKLLSMQDAIARFVPDGASLALGTALETMIPFAAGYEIMRRRKRDLTLIGPISDCLFDQLIGAGCARAVYAAWVGNVITGSGYNFRRACESGAIEVRDYSNFTMALALQAGAQGVPFLPTYTALGSDLFGANPGLSTTTCPFTGRTLTAVAALNPDVAIVHVQRADEYGSAHAWGNLGVTREACLAAERVIVTCEEIVPSAVIRSDPNRVVAPAFRVSAVVHAPWGAHPSPVPGYYNRDHQAFLDYQDAGRTPASFARWLDEWVGGTREDGYARRVGQARLDTLALSVHLRSQAVDYGY